MLRKYQKLVCNALACKPNTFCRLCGGHIQKGSKDIPSSRGLWEGITRLQEEFIGQALPCFFCLRFLSGGCNGSRETYFKAADQSDFESGMIHADLQNKMCMSCCSPFLRAGDRKFREKQWQSSQNVAAFCSGSLSPCTSTDIWCYTQRLDSSTSSWRVRVLMIKAKWNPGT